MENNICLGGGLQEHRGQPYMDSCKNKGFLHKFADTNTASSSPCL